MDAASRLSSVDNDEAVVSIARRHLGHDRRLMLEVGDGASFVRRLVAERRTFDLVFADTWPGKYTDLQDALRLVAVGGLYVVDDMRPQPNWPEDHPPKVAALVDTLTSLPDFQTVVLSWSTGIIAAVRVR
jgi:predicted O-methyltransferase YrrM